MLPAELRGVLSQLSSYRCRHRWHVAKKKTADFFMVIFHLFCAKQKLKKKKKRCHDVRHLANLMKFRFPHFCFHFCHLTQLTQFSNFSKAQYLARDIRVSQTLVSLSLPRLRSSAQRQRWDEVGIAWKISLVGLEHDFYFSIYWEVHHPN